jgi:hypothetical protein
VSIETLLYWYSVINKFDGFFVCLIISVVLATSAILTSYSIESEGVSKNIRFYARATIWLGAIVAVISLFIPSKDTMTLLAATKVSREIISGSPVPEKILTILHHRLDKEINKKEEGK